LLHPAADLGVHRVAVLASSTLRLKRQCTFHDASPFEAFPSPAAIPLRIPTLLPLVIRGWPVFRVFLRWRVRDRPLVLPRTNARCSLGFLLVVFRSSPCFVRGLNHRAVLAGRVLADWFGCSRGCLSKSFLLTTSLSSVGLRRSVVSMGYRLVVSCSRSVRKHRFSGIPSKASTASDGPGRTMR